METWAVGEKVGLAELRESCGSIGDQEALNNAWERDGYLFFRDVLDAHAIAELRSVYLEEMEKLGVINNGDSAGRYNGADLAPLPQFPGGIQGLFDRAPWRRFVANPDVNKFVSSVLGDDPYWVPVVGYRVQPPTCSADQERFTYVHQDGFFNPGIPFMNCWIPLSEMDGEVGGITVAEGCHKQDFHSGSTPPNFPVKVNAIPQSAWRTTDYRPGDLLIMHLDLPHTGITNISKDRFRMSLDIRMLPSSGPLPTIGTVISADSRQIIVKGGDGTTKKFSVDSDTYCRAMGPNKLTLDQIPDHIQPGNEIIVSSDGDRALVVRPASY